MKLAAVLALLGLAALASAASPPGPVVTPFKGGAALAKGLASNPILFVANIQLKPGADVDKFIAAREAVAARGIKAYPGVTVLYLKGAPQKVETLPQGSAKLEYATVAALVTAPDAKSYVEYNKAVAKDPEYVSSGGAVERVVRVTNISV